MARRKRMTKAELTTLCDGWVQDALRHDHDLNSDSAVARGKAIDFYEGRVDIPSEVNKSSVVSPDLANVLEWIHPGLLRVFLASEKVVEYKPNTPDDEQGATQATWGVNYEFLRGDIAGYAVLSAALHDSLLHGNGVIKHWFEAAKQYKTETLTGLTEEQYFALLEDETVEEVLEKREYYVDAASGQEVDEDETEQKVTSDVEEEAETKTY